MIRRPIAILTLLTALNFVNYLDRYELAAVLPRVQAELGFSSFVAGLLATVFLLSFLATCPIFGILGDRMDRKTLLALGAFGWSAATIATGMSRSVVTLVIARAFVGIGEASFTTLAPTVIDDVAPVDKKSRWLGIFSIAGPVGSALGYIVGGAVEKKAGWHAAFFVGGVPGIVLGILVLLMHEPPRHERNRLNLLEVLRTLVRIPDYRSAVMGYAALTAAVGGFAYWAPSFLFRRFHIELAAANFRFGLMTVVAGAIATLLGGAAGDAAQKRAERRLRAERDEAGGGPTAPVYREMKRSVPPTEEEVNDAKATALLRVCAMGSAAAVPLGVACFLSPSPTLFFVFAFLCEIGIFLSNAPINTVLLRVVPSSLRASAMAVCITSIHLFGDMWSPAIVGRLADLTGDEKIQLAMMPLPLAFFLSALFWWPFGRLKKNGR